MIHALITSTIAAMAWLFGWHQEAALLVATFYIGREHAQAEYRAIKSFYGGKRASAPWWCGFEPRAWNGKAIIDGLGPAMVAISASFI